ncbi:uncharacterized protein [Apteryx mantelli]|uniref:Uncharacterized protein n=1 Tax=Apteryx mantelli TaxID=2696672 RepID=A0ABM4G3J4_9AVES
MNFVQERSESCIVMMPRTVALVMVYNGYAITHHGASDLEGRRRLILPGSPPLICNVQRLSEAQVLPKRRPCLGEGEGGSLVSISGEQERVMRQAVRTHCLPYLVKKTREI